MADVWSQLQEILDYVAANITDPPNRRFVANGEPAFEQCEQLTIHLSGIRRGTPPQQRPDVPCGPSNVIATLTRTWCIPIGEGPIPPTIAEMEASGQEVVNGAWELHRAAASAARLVSCRPSIESTEPIGPAGGFVAWRVVMSWVP